MGLRLLRDGKPCLDSDHYRVLVSRAIGAMMHVRPPLPEPGQDVHPLTGALAERACWLFCTGITEASRLCREFGFDPAYERR